jgi:GNAT superfamily N-acetyltransferase
MKITRRPATAADVEFARALHAACYRDVVLEQFGDWDPALQAEFFEQKWLEGEYEIIEIGNIAIGVVATQSNPDHLFVSEIQVDPSHQGHGIGTAVMGEIIALANSAEVPIRLQVLRFSRALSWYKRLGFVQTGETETHVLLERSFDIV